MDVQSLWHSPFFALSLKMDPQTPSDPKPDFSMISFRIPNGAQVRSTIGVTTKFAGDEVLVGMLHADPQKRPTAGTLCKASLIA